MAEQKIAYTVDDPGDASCAILLAHGAGAGMHHAFMHQLASELMTFGCRVIRYQFSYLEEGRRFPASPKPDIATVGRMVEMAAGLALDLPLFLAGKSYGGRMSSHWVAQNPGTSVKGLIYFGFPLHPAGKPSKNRAEHLYPIPTPQLFLQGTRDALADFDLIKEVVANCPHATLHTITHADHSFAIPKRLSETSSQQVIRSLAAATHQWITRQLYSADTN